MSQSEVDGALQSVEKMYSENAFDSDTYYKCLIALASEYLCTLHDTEKCLILLNKCPNTYFDSVLYPQLREDSMFLEAFLDMSHRLDKLGMGLSEMVLDELYKFNV